MSTENFLAKLEQINTRKFLLPILQEEVTYRKMDVIESSVDNSLPGFIASKVLEAMKKSVSGEQEQLEVPAVEDKDIKELVSKATMMWDRLVLEPKLSLEQISLVPSEDRLAWFLNAVSESQQLETKGGGVENAEEVANFPDKRRSRGNAKRSATS